MFHLYVCKETRIIHLNFQKRVKEGKCFISQNASTMETRFSKCISKTASILIRQVHLEKRAEETAYLPSFDWGPIGNSHLCSQEEGLLVYLNPRSWRARYTTEASLLPRDVCKEPGWDRQLPGPSVSSK